jgi:NAD(P)-dependent dehydrogenase (short-subunit alcohol dehydrogenase family)
MAWSPTETPVHGIGTVAARLPPEKRMTATQGGKRIFITGGASGLGLALAQRYARDGWRVAIGDVNDTRGQQAQRQLTAQAAEALYLRCDVTREEDLLAVADQLQTRWGGVDVVVNNAGVAQAGAIEDVPLSDWQWILDINLLGVVRGCKVFTRQFKQQGHGHIVNIASMAGLLHPPNMASYNASKAAVVSLSETLEAELAGSGIGVTLVCPSFFKTNLTESMRTTDPRMLKSMQRLFDRGRLSAEQIADQIHAAQQAGTFYVLPHPEGVKAWRLKRLLPRALYLALLNRRTRKMRGSQKPQEAA